MVMGWRLQVNHLPKQHLRITQSFGSIRGGSLPNVNHVANANVEVKVIAYYTPFAVWNEPEPVLRYPSIRVRFSTYLYANSGHLKIKLFRKRQKNLENNGLFLSANGP